MAPLLVSNGGRKRASPYGMLSEEREPKPALHRCVARVLSFVCCPCRQCLNCGKWTCTSLIGKRGRASQVKAVLTVFVLLFIYQLFADNNLTSAKFETMYEYMTAKSVQYVLPPIPQAIQGQLYNDPEVAVALLGLGAMASQLKCEAAVESLGKIGGWQGRVYLFTDKEECFDVEDMKRRGGGLDLRVVNIAGDYSGSFTLPSLSATKGNRLRAKLLKSRLFKEITDPQVQRIMYMDCDEVVAVPGCVKPMFHEMFDDWGKDENIRFRFTRLHETDAKDVSMNRDMSKEIAAQYNNPHFMIHAGFFAITRTDSEKALQEWENELSTMKYAHDRIAFITAMQRVQKQSREQHTENYMKLGTWRSGWERFADARMYDLPCVVHVSHKRCLWQGRKNIQSIIDRLQLETYKRGDNVPNTPYCESPLAYPFTLGWVPYKSCRKIETLI